MKDFHTPLFGCCEDIGTCLCVFCVPGIGALGHSCQNYAGVREETFVCLHCLFCVSEFWTRTTIRDRYGMDRRLWEDFCTFLFCAPCVIVQDHREIQYLNKNKIGNRKKIQEFLKSENSISLENKIPTILLQNQTDPNSFIKIK